MAEADGLELISSFLVVAEELNFRRAAERLNLDQSALTRRIQKLEQTLRFRLFERTTREVALTQAGHSLYKDNAFLLSRYGDSIDNARRIAEGKSGLIRVAYMAFSATELMPAALARFRRLHAHVEVSLRYMRTQGQKLALANDEIDAGYLIGPFVHPDFQTLTLSEEQLYVVTPRGHRLLQRPVITPADLASEPVILGDMQEWGEYRWRLANLFNSEGIALDVTVEASNTLALIGLVAAGLGITIYPESLLGFIGRNVEARPIIHRAFRSQTVLAWKKSNRSKQLLDFIEVARHLRVRKS